LKVLITGSYGGFLTGIASKFVKEGCTVAIIGCTPSCVLIDDFEYSKIEKTPGCKIYNISPSDSECKEIFEAYRFDIVINISASFAIGSQDDSDQYFSGFFNILKLSEKIKVKKFIYISSADIYGNAQSLPVSEDLSPEPVNFRGAGDVISEYCCSKWNKFYGLNTLCLRVSEIYGPGCSAGNDSNGGNIISSIISSAYKKKTVEIYAESGSTKDFIYIDDAVEGIYKASINRNCTGIINLSSNTETSTEELLKIISNIKKPKKVFYKITDGKMREIARMQVSNEKIKRLIEWEPKTALIDGIKKTFERHAECKKEIVNDERKEKEPADKKELKIKKTSGKTALAVFENIILFLFFAFLQFGGLFLKVKLPDLRIDLLIVYIIIAAALWGQVQAYLAMILSAALFVGVNMFSGVDVITFIYTPENLMQIAVYILVGIITGYTIERRNREVQSWDLNYQSLKNKYMFLLDIYNETKVIKNELQNQIIDTEDSFSTIYEIVREVESLEIERVFSGAVNAIERIMKTNQVSIYTLSSDGASNFMRLKARSLALTDRISNSIKISDFPQIKEVVESKSIYVNKRFEKGIPVMIAPVLDDKKVIAVVSIHDTEFENLTMHYENLFTTVINLITNALKRAYIFEASLKDKRYLSKTRILTAETFEKILTEVKKNKEELNMSYSLLKVLNSGHSYSEVSERIVSCIRENDYIGLSSDGNLYILLSNTNNNYAKIAADRLSSNGISAEPVQEELINE